MLLERLGHEAAEEALVAHALQAHAAPQALRDASVQVDERVCVVAVDGSTPGHIGGLAGFNARVKGSSVETQQN